MADQEGQDGRGLLDDLPVEHLKAGIEDLLTALAERATATVTDKLEDLTGRLADYAENGGPGLMAAVTGGKALTEGKLPVKAALSAGWTGVKEKIKQAVGAGSGGGGGRKVRVVNIIEEFDVGLPVRAAYNQWTQFQDFPTFTRKVNSVEQASDEKVNWKAQIFLSHRTWESTITEQVPDDRIVWRSRGAKGHVDGTVTFHALAPNMTRILLVLEYHPQGFFEKTGNIWRAQGRRARSDFKHIKRHMMTRTILEQDTLEGWRGEIRDSEVVKTHEDAIREEQEREEHEAQQYEPSAGEDYAYDDEYDRGDEDEDREHSADEATDADDVDTYDEDDYEDEEDEEDEDTAGEAQPSRARAARGR